MTVVITDELVDEFDAEQAAARAAADAAPSPSAPTWAAEVVDAASRATEPGLVGLSDAELLSAELDLAHARDVLAAAEARVLAEVDTRNATDADLGVRAGTWLSRRRHAPLGKSRWRVRVARRLADDFGEMWKAVCAGEIGWDHVEAVVAVANPRNTDGLVCAQWQLITAARSMTWGEWHRHLKILAETELDPDGPEPEWNITDNQLWATRLWDGTTQLKGQLVGAESEELRTALDVEMERVFRNFQTQVAAAPDDLSMPPESTIRAIALVNLVRLGAGASPDHQASGAQVTVTVHASDPLAPDTPDAATLQDGTRRQLLCDSALTAVIVDKLGNPLDVGRTKPLATPAMRDAVFARDGGCTNRGCESPPRRIRYHHVHHRERGGPTRVSVLAGVCDLCHGIAHRNGWSVTMTDDQWTIWQTPSGHRYWGQRHGTTRSDPLPPRDAVPVRPDRSP